MHTTREGPANPPVTILVGKNNETSHSFVTKEQLQDVLKVEAERANKIVAAVNF